MLLKGKNSAVARGVKKKGRQELLFLSPKVDTLFVFR